MIDVSYVAIQIRAIIVTQTLHVAFVRYGIAEVIVLTLPREALDLSEYGIVDYDPVHAGIVVRIPQCRLDVDGIVDDAEFVPYAIGDARPAGPFGVLSRGGIGIREQSDEEGGVDAGISKALDLIAHLGAIGKCDRSGVDFRGAGC